MPTLGGIIFPFHYTWSKTRRNRFSKFVADHFQLPKRRRSMVVETGFPTSLIDLYVRHRGTFGKSSDKKQKGIDSPNYLSSGSLSSSSSSDLDYRPSVAASDKYSKTEAELSVGMRKLNPVLVVVLKVLFMMVLVFGTKTFTIAITLFASLLLFLESRSKRFLGRPVCSQVLEIEEQVELRQKELDEVTSEVLIETRGKSSRRAMMKSRIKKLVPKKLRIRKPSIDSKQEICCEFKEEETGRRSSSSILSSETECDDGKSGTNVQRNSDCLVLFLIVLVGLLEGRVFALVIALSWCLLLKLQWRNVRLNR
ncbi:hypothetical protein HanIR_Chr08g0360511 [Helianthus annuus]|nr:uncharacterized protein LOC110872642 isoform X1 [Helianthus annuus]XP_035832529.1 uncharacterized protein LOC110872642 isoform X1 [Helianthus annuus]KAJ0546399.1 hypothetical protein HanIR_Chr08g0360511 [Helianthus annuus]